MGMVDRDDTCELDGWMDEQGGLYLRAGLWMVVVVGHGMAGLRPTLATETCAPFYTCLTECKCAIRLDWLPF